MSQFISLQQAIDMTTLYRAERENILAEAYKEQNILALSETFDRGEIDEILSKSGCEAIRIYYGMDEELRVHAILVPVDENNEDILPPSNEINVVGDDIVEQSRRCPDDCPPESPLNS